MTEALTTASNGFAAGSNDIDPSSGQIVVDRVTRYFKEGQVHALDEISFDVKPGEFVSLVGPSGCGKTTVLRIIDGLLPPDGGRVLVGGKPPTPGPNMGFVFQQARLMPWRTVHANVEFPLIVQRVPKSERDRRISEVLESVGLQAFANAHPHELSGGMQQRVGLARSFVLSPNVLLMDEPFGALDAMTREFMRVELLRIWDRLKTAVVFVTHDIDEAILLSQRIVLLRPRPGRVEEILTVDLPERRWEGDIAGLPRFRELHDYLWERISEMVSDSSDWAHQLGARVKGGALPASTEQPAP